MSSFFQSSYECEDVRRRFVRRRSVIVGYLRLVNLALCFRHEKLTRICILRELIEYTIDEVAKFVVDTGKRITQARHPAFVIV
jgi:hypothetical protein